MHQCKTTLTYAGMQDNIPYTDLNNTKQTHTLQCLLSWKYSKHTIAAFFDRLA